MKNRNLVLLSFVALKLLLQLIAINPLYELHRDEYLHLDLGNHLAWGYISVPPFTAALSFLIISMGKSVFWIKFFPALFGALTLVVVWKTVEALGGQLFCPFAQRVVRDPLSPVAGQYSLSTQFI